MTASDARAMPLETEPPKSLFERNRNCWVVERASRASVLIDAAAYFALLRSTLANAEREIWMLGWDFHSRTRLVPEAEDGDPVELGEYLEAILHRNRRLHVRILAWDFSMIYTLEREWTPIYDRRWSRHRRLQFRFDAAHPPGASHHQKVVVVDNRVAFSGGLDLTKCRWDEPSHRALDERRVDPDGEAYGPFHDVQMMVEGKIAASLGDLARERWQRATKKRIRKTRETENSPWPATRKADFENADLAISRTLPPHDGRAGVFEIEQLHRDAIAAARRMIYLENQYVTSAVVSECLVARLTESEGPEVVVVAPLQASGWLEQQTMDVMRARFLRRLRGADRHGRFRVYAPVVPGDGSKYVNVHSKLMVVDDRILIIGSANLSNRSMRLDSECNLGIDADDDPAQHRGVAQVRNQLLAEHLGVTPESVRTAIEERGGLIAAVESIRGGDRTLEPVGDGEPEDALDSAGLALVADPEKPIDPDSLLEQLLETDEKPKIRSGVAWSAGLVLAMLAAAGIWFWLGRSGELSPATVAAYLLDFGSGPWLLPTAMATFVLAVVAAAPINLMVLAVALLCGPLLGFVISFVGTALGSAIGYGLGRRLSRGVVRRFAGKRLNRISERLGEHGFAAVVAIRLLPVAPFGVVNIVAGASHIRFRAFMLGTMVAITPGILLLTLFAEGLLQAITNPGPATVAIAVGVGGLIVAAALVVRRRLKTNDQPADARTG